jgi:hypothetical protein
VKKYWLAFASYEKSHLLGSGPQKFFAAFHWNAHTLVMKRPFAIRPLCNSFNGKMAALELHKIFSQAI